MVVIIIATRPVFVNSAMRFAFAHIFRWASAARFAQLQAYRNSAISTAPAMRACRPDFNPGHAIQSFRLDEAAK
jgi:hypothetical protein